MLLAHDGLLPLPAGVAWRPVDGSATAGTATVIDAGVSAGAANALLYAWFAAVLVSTVYVAFDAFTNNPEQPLGSTIHCVAGDATGIVVAAIITPC